MVEWDETKRRSNLAKHGFDFVHADQVLFGTHVLIPSTHPGEEQRFLAIGIIEGRFATVVFTMRGENYRIISIRSARDGERKKYQALHARGTPGDA